MLKVIIDNLKDYPYSQPRLVQYGLILVAIAAIEGILRFYMRRLLIGTSRKIEYSLRSDFFIHLQRLDSSFFENNRTGSIMALITNDLNAVRNFMGPGLLHLFNTIFVFISTLTIMFFINVKLTLFTLIAIPVLPFLVSRLSRMLYKRFKISQEHYATLSARTQENIAGIRVIKSFSQEEKEIENFKDLNQGYIDKNMALARVRSAFWPLMILIGGIGAFIVLLVGGRLVIFGQISLGEFVQFSAYIIILTWPLISLGWVINLIQRGEVSMGRLNKVFGIMPSIREPAKPKKIKDINGEIIFKNIYFRYPEMASYEFYEPGKSGRLSKNKKTGNRWVLEDINLNISAGKQVGIVGFTGSGKSTIVNLVPRLYNPQKGRIFIDGYNIEKISIGLLRKSIGYVTQDPFIFSKTIRENILLGSEEMLLKLPEGKITEKIIQASSTAHLNEDIRDFPDGYSTLVGERGITLSGGQKQRLAIARALIIRPSILILDDSFSNIDTNTEELILKDLKKKTKKITTIIISHRISTIKDSDMIIVMDEGKIMKTGTHKDLVRNSDIYRRLYHRQKLSEELKEEI